MSFNCSNNAVAKKGTQSDCSEGFEHVKLKITQVKNPAVRRGVAVNYKDKAE